jgi:hypothetical protein
MADEIAGMADIVTGAAIARAVEPETSETRGFDSGNGLSGNCLNCGGQLVGAHCHSCGQKGNVHRTLSAFGHDFMHSVLHFDGKIWRTLPMLMWRPGELTRRYVHGERAKFVSPLALFLFTVFLTFATFNYLVPSDLSANSVIDSNSAEKEYIADRKEILQDIAEIEDEKRQAVSEGQSGLEWMDDAIARHRQSLKSLDEGRGKDIRLTEMASRKMAIEKAKLDTEIARQERELAVAQQAGEPTNAIAEQLESNKLTVRMMDKAANAFGKGENPKRNWTFTNSSFFGAKRLNEAAKNAAENPQLLLYKIQSNTYKYSWALIPISVPFVWLLFFWRRRFKMFDHAVFVTYSLTFMMLLGIVVAVLFQVPGLQVIGGLALAFLPPIHMYRQLHQAYETTRFGAFWRMCALTVFAIAALTLFAIMIVTLGITG